MLDRSSHRARAAVLPLGLLAAALGLSLVQRVSSAADASSMAAADAAPIQAPRADGAVDCTPMTPARMRALIERLDPAASMRGNVWEFTVDEASIALVFDTGADRMRLMMPVVEADEVDAEGMRRLLEANFDTALDARYAIARGILWATFIHPLSTPVRRGTRQRHRPDAEYRAHLWQHLFLRQLHLRRRRRRRPLSAAVQPAGPASP
jgi:hypothetical protein